MVGSYTSSAYNNLCTSFNNQSFPFRNSVMVSQISYCITRPYDDVFVCFITTIVASRIFSLNNS